MQQNERSRVAELMREMDRRSERPIRALRKNQDIIEAISHDVGAAVTRYIADGEPIEIGEHDSDSYSGRKVITFAARCSIQGRPALSDAHVAEAPPSFPLPRHPRVGQRRRFPRSRRHFLRSRHRLPLRRCCSRRLPRHPAASRRRPCPLHRPPLRRRSRCCPSIRLHRARRDHTRAGSTPRAMG